MNNEIILRLGSNIFTGWKQVQISQSINRCVGSFAMSYTENDSSQSYFKIGLPCYVEINGHRLISGYIDEVDNNYTDSTHELQIRGRDKLGDLADCSNWGPSSRNEFNDQSVLNIIKALCKPFSITVETDDSATSAVSLKPTSPWKPAEGDTAFDSILYLCQISAIIPISYGDGKLTLTRASSNKANTALELGKNIKSGNINQSNVNRFSHYILKGSGKGDDDEKELKEIAQPTATKTDTLITRHRPLVIISNDSTTSIKALKNQARWEASTRAGLSRRYSYDVVGWLQENGEPWKINSLVKIKDPMVKVTDELLITDLDFTLDDLAGQMTRMTLFHPDSFKLISWPEKITGSGDDILSSL